MSNKFFFAAALIVITFIGGFLRFYKMPENPPSLNGDEISFGYAAYSILKTGKDDNGNFLPLVIQSVGDYKNPLPAYLMILPIKLFGLNDFSVRLQNALIGTIMIPVFFLFLKNFLKNKLAALLGSFFLAISSWHIYYSRYAYETLIASFFVLLGIWFFMKMFEGKRRWAYLSAFFLMLTMYTAPAPRLFIPVFIIASLVFKFQWFRKNRDKLTIFILTSVILGLPLVYATLFQKAGARLAMVLISNDIDFQRYVILGDLKSISDFFLLIFFWIKRYFNYLQPDFLFFNALNMTLPGTFGLGLLYLFEIPFLILGIIEFIRRKILYKPLFAIWLLTGIVPDSLTNNQQYAGRLLHIAPVVLLITTLGAIQFVKLILSFSKIYMKVTALGIFSIIVIITLIHALLTFSVHFPRARGEAFDEGLKQVALYIRDHENEYNEIIIDPHRGVDGPYLVSNPYLYILFYTKYDPHIYQIEPKVSSKDKTYFFKFNKYTFRDINWSKDKLKKGTLFIGSPWSIPEKDLKTGELLKRVNLSSGPTAFLIASPK